MNIFDFQLSRYRQLLDAALENGWKFRTVEAYIEAENPPDHCIILRHDVDRRPATALVMARTEAERDVNATYYFRTRTFEEETVDEIASLGYEIGYHYEDLSEARGDMFEARRRFEENLDAFREHVDVRTVSGHGRSLSPYTDEDLLVGRVDEFEELGIIGDASLSIEAGPDSNTYYLSDVSRTWEADLPTVGTVRTTADVIEAIEQRPDCHLYINAHPDRWTRSPAAFIYQFTWDLTAECAKVIASSLYSLLPDHQVEVPDETEVSSEKKDP